MVVRISTSRQRRRVNASALFGLLSLTAVMLGAAYLAGRTNAGQSSAPRQRVFVPEFNVVQIPVPQAPVAAGTLVRDIAVRFEKFPEHQLPHEVVRDLKTHFDQVVIASLPGGLPIVSTNLGQSDDLANPIVGRIPPGMRAMTVRVDATAAVEGWVQSGSIVDVLLVEPARTTVVAEQVSVISAERSLSPRIEGRHDPIPSTVTLLVTQEQCLAINTAVGLGKIAFALRSARDPESWQKTQFSAEALSRNSESPEKKGARVTGVVSFDSGSGRRRMALVDGSWIPTEEIPSGFLTKD